MDASICYKLCNNNIYLVLPETVLLLYCYTFIKLLGKFIFTEDKHLLLLFIFHWVSNSIVLF